MSTEKAQLVMDMFHRTMVHHTLWFTEVMHQVGMERALEIMEEAWEKSYHIQVKRLSKFLDFDIQDGVPAYVQQMDDDTSNRLMEELGKNWLAVDGVWFQAVEHKLGMNDAKRCNDSCWAKFSPFEASSIKKLLGMGTQPGLDGLKKALQYRMYARVNTQSITDETANSFVFQMNECRVQLARKRKGMDDYPCKSAGLVEYTYFASAIDKRIKTECIGCPPDPHPDEWFCAWRFYTE